MSRLCWPSWVCRLSGDRRGVSVTVGYVLMLGVAAILLGVLLTGATGLLEGQSERVIDDELTVIGNQLAANINEADRVAGVARADANTTGASVTVNHTIRLPDTVAGSGYLVTVERGTITLTSANPDVEVTVAYPETDLDVATEEFSGGDVTVVYNGSADPPQLEVES